MTARNPSEEAAQRYARVGWPVFPCHTDEKIPATKNGFKDATTDPEKIAWFWKQSQANVAIATGSPGPDVVDVDLRKDGVSGYVAWNRLQREGLVNGPSAIVRTPSGGMHAYFKGTGQRNGHVASAGIDYRAAGGYVVAPPSVVGSRPYVLIQHEPSTATVNWLAIRSVLQPETERRHHHRPERSTEPGGDVSRLAGWLTRQPEGNRNHGLYYAANRALEAGHADLDELAEAARQLGLTEREISRTIESARKTAQLPFERPAQRELEAG